MVKLNTLARKARLLSNGQQVYIWFKDDFFRRVLINSGWLLSANTVAMGLTFIQGIIVARVLGVEQYGVLALVTTYTATLTQFVDSRVWEAAIKFVIRYREEGNLARATAMVKLCYLVDVATGALAFLLIVLTADWGAQLFLKDSSAAGLIRLFAPSVLISTPIGTSSAILRIGDKFGLLAYQNVGVALFRLIGVVVSTILLGYRVQGLLVVYLLTAIFSISVLWIMCRRVCRELGLVWWRSTQLSVLRGEFTSIGRFLLTTNASALFKVLQRNADVLLIGYWLNPLQVGYFRYARSLTDLMSFPVAPLYTSSYPEFTRLWHQGHTRALRALISRLTLLSALVALPALLVVGVGGEWVIRLAVGEQYLPALPVFRWLALGVAIAVVTNFGHPLLLAIGEASSSLIAVIVGVICQLLLLFLLLPVIGIVAAGLSYLGFYLIWTIVMVIVTRSFWRIKPV